MQHKSEYLDLRLCDNMELMAQYPDKHFELAICDPPYGIERAGHKGDPKHGWKKHEIKTWDKEPPDKEYFQELFRVSQNQIICGANYFTQNLPPSKGWVYWCKGQKLTMSDGEFIFTSFDVAARDVTINRCEIKLDGSIHLLRLFITASFPLVWTATAMCNFRTDAKARNYSLSKQHHLPKF